MSNNGKDWGKIKKEFEESELEMPETQEDEELDETVEPSLDYAELEQKLMEAEAEAQKNRNQALLATAELKNAAQRAEREIQKAHLYATEKFVDSLLPVADSLEQAALAVGPEQSSIKEGLELTIKLFNDALKKQGVEQLNPEGMVFNPQEHEAMSMQAIPGVEDNTIVNVFQKGYKLNGRVIRPARVIVAKSV